LPTPTSMLLVATCRGVKLVNAVVTGSTFEGADLTDTVSSRGVYRDVHPDNTTAWASVQNAHIVCTCYLGLCFQVWEDALVGGEDVKRLCANPTLVGESRLQVGCRR
jgi:hypothetical protein